MQRPMSVAPTPANTPLVSAETSPMTMRMDRSAAALAAGLQRVNMAEEEQPDFFLPPPQLTRQHNVQARYLKELRGYLVEACTVNK